MNFSFNISLRLMSKPKYIIPVKTGDQLELTVESQGSSGDGICRHEGYTLFLPSGLPGDRVTAEVIKTTPRFGVTRLLNRIEPSPDRVEPPCAAFPECGGCKLQDLSYEKQLAFKVQVVADTLKHIGKIEAIPEIQIVPADKPYHYRNKGSFSLSEKAGRLHIGFFKQGTHEVVDADTCDILLPEINEAKEWIRRLLVKHQVSIYNESHHKGFLRGLVIRKSESTGEMLIGFVTTRGRFQKSFFQDITHPESISHFKISGIAQNLNEQRTNVILGEKTRPIFGTDYFQEKLGELHFRLSLNSFWQVNSGQTVKLYDLISQWTDPEAGRVLDGYSGIGGIALWLARSGAQVTGIEEVRPAVNDARESALLNNISSCDFLSGTLEKHTEHLIARRDIATLVLDPPRKGCSEEVINAIPKLNPETVIYISCNPSTLARDLERLTGYQIKEIRVVDMFPQTQHVETAVLLQRR